jgi:hypothetical protein
MLKRLGGLLLFLHLSRLLSQKFSLNGDVFRQIDGGGREADAVDGGGGEERKLLKLLNLLLPICRKLFAKFCGKCYKTFYGRKLCIF